MKSSRRTFVASAAAAAVVLGSRTAVAAPTPDDPEFALYALTRLDDLYRGKSSHGTMRMEVQTANFNRVLEMETWSRGSDHSLVRILSPKKERGTATLKSKGDLFTYLNKTSRTIKITGGMLSASWMGSHFTNDDLIHDSRLSRDFSIVRTYSGPVAGVDIHLFTLTPNPDAAVVWGRIEVVLRQSDLLPLRQVFYDEDGERVREMRFSAYREIQGRTLPTQIMMKPLDGSDEFTKLTYLDIEFEVDLDEAFFSLQRLKGVR